MPHPGLKTPDLRALSHLAEDARLGLDAFDAAGAGIAAAMRENTLDPDGACQLLTLANEAMKAKLDALVNALAKARVANEPDGYPVLRAGNDTTSPPSRNCTR